MRRRLFLLLAFVASSAIAGTPEMVAQCEEVMRCNLCRVANDKSEPGATKLVTYLDDRGKAQSRRVSIADYDYIRDTGYEKTKDGRFLMCVRVAEVMKDPTSVRAMGARALFSQTWRRQRYCP